MPGGVVSAPEQMSLSTERLHRLPELGEGPIQVTLLTVLAGNSIPVADTIVPGGSGLSGPLALC